MAATEHDAVQAELARFFIARKAALGLGDRADSEIMEQADEIALYLAARIGMAQMTGDDRFLQRFGWLVRAFQRLDRGERVVGLDG